MLLRIIVPRGTTLEVVEAPPEPRVIETTGETLDAANDRCAQSPALARCPAPPLHLRRVS